MEILTVINLSISFFWAVALIAVGVIYYKKNISCSTCKSNPKHADFFSTITKEQKTCLSTRQAVILIPDNADPIYVDENIAYSNAQLIAFSYEQPEPLTQDELKQIISHTLHRKYVDKMDENLRSLYAERKLAVLQSKSGDFFIVALKEYLEEPLESLAFSFPRTCNYLFGVCEGTCGGWFQLPACAPSASCDWADKCTFYCFIQSPPDCMETSGECCYSL